MQYMLMIHSDDSGFFAMKPAEQQQALGAYMAFTEALRKAGALVGSNRLMPSADSTIVRVANGKVAGAERTVHRQRRSNSAATT